MNEDDSNNSDSLSMNSSSHQRYSKKPFNQNTKRPQVYSNYIQPNLQYNNNQAVSNSSQPGIIKKPKINQNDFEENGINNASENQQIQVDSAYMSYLNSFLGVNSFQSENVFLDLIANDLILVSLDSEAKSKKNNFCFKGKCSLALVYGRLAINGYDLKTNLNDPVKWFDLYSPETNSFLSISNKLNLSENITEANLEQQQTVLINRIKIMSQIDPSVFPEQSLRQFLRDFISNTTSLFLLRGFKSNVCNYFGYFDNLKQIYHSYQSLNKDNQSRVQNDAAVKFSHSGLYPVPENSFNAVLVESDDEREILNEFAYLNDEKKKANFWPVVMACGGKDVGKSTLLRFWINVLLNHYPSVAYIDCDPGQCEFTLSGCVSLNLISEPIFGPPHTHIGHTNTSKSCYFLGHLSPSDCPGYYLQCIKQCYEDYSSYKLSLNNNQIVPLIVNTMGWNQGLGLCLLKDTILLVKPTHIVQINHPIEANKNMPVLDKAWLENAEGWLNKVKNSNQMHQVPNESAMKANQTSSKIDNIDYKLILFKSRAPSKTQNCPGRSLQKRFSPKDHRNIATIAYFSNLQDPKQYFKSIHSLRPYHVPWSKFGLHVSHSRIHYDQLFRVFNASLVGLCNVDPKFLIKKVESEELPKILETYDSEKNEPVVYKCFGFGIIRGINMETKEFYILTPESIQTLESVNLLVNGMLNLPQEFFFEQDAETRSPYVSYSNNLHPGLNQNPIGHEPFQRKYLVHQGHYHQTN